MKDELKRIGVAAGSGPRSVVEARAVVADSRARISATIDELEERIIDKKEELQGRLDVARPVRTLVDAAPLAVVAAALGAGLLLGLAGGGRRRDERELELGDGDRAAIRRWRRERRRRLLRAAEDEQPGFEAPPSRLGRLFRDLTHEFAGAATALLVAQLAERVQQKRD